MDKMKKMYLVLFAFVFLFSCKMDVFAWQTGSQAGGGGSTGSGDVVYNTAGTEKYNLGAYKFDLVYRPKDSGFDNIACAVVYTGNHGSFLNDSDARDKVRQYAEDDGCTFLTDEKDLFVKFGKNLDNGESIDDWTVEKREDARKYFKEFGDEYELKKLKKTAKKNIK